jgi:hypothetical protein
MGGITVLSRTQRIVVAPRTSITVKNAARNAHVSVIDAGPIGPPGSEGPPGADADEVVVMMLGAHENSPAPHPAYDDIPDFTILFENGLF